LKLVATSIVLNLKKYIVGDTVHYIKSSDSADSQYYVTYARFRNYYKKKRNIVNTQTQTQMTETFLKTDSNVLICITFAELLKKMYVIVDT